MENENKIKKWMVIKPGCVFRKQVHGSRYRRNDIPISPRSEFHCYNTAPNLKSFGSAWKSDGKTTSNLVVVTGSLKRERF
jgi:hypothetical protein